MRRYLLNLMCQGLVIDMRAGYYPDLLAAYSDALYGQWESTRMLDEDGQELLADSGAGRIVAITSVP